MQEKEIVEPLFTYGQVIIAAVAGSGVWVWRAVTLARGFGALANEVKRQGQDTRDLRDDIRRLGDKLDTHIAEGRKG